MRHRGFCTWGIQTGPFAAGRADSVPKNFHFPIIHTERSNSLLSQLEEGERRRAGAFERMKGKSNADTVERKCCFKTPSESDGFFKN